MIKRALAAHVAAALAGFAASAADLPERTFPPLPTAGPLFSWTGYYAGINAGYAFSGRQTVRTTGVTPLDQAIVDAAGFSAVRSEQDGVTAGGGFGFNYQLTQGYGLVAGWETDIQYTGLAGSRTASTTFDENTITLSGGQTLHFLGTVRGRFGYAFGRALIYGTGGLAYGDVTYQAMSNLTALGGTIPFDAGHFSGMETGYTFGGGAEFALPEDSVLNVFKSGAVTVKAEYLHYNLGSRNLTIAGVGSTFGPGGPTPVGQTGISRFRTEGSIVRVGLNYKFGTY